MYIKVFSSHLPISVPIFLNWPTPAYSSFIFGLFKETSIQFLQQINVNKRHVNPVYSAGIRTHNLSNMSRLP